MTNLKKRILKSGLKLKDMSRLTNIKYKTVSRQCVTGIKTVRVAQRYAKALGCSPAELLEF